MSDMEWSFPAAGLGTGELRCFSNSFTDSLVPFPVEWDAVPVINVCGGYNTTIVLFEGNRTFRVGGSFTAPATTPSDAKTEPIDSALSDLLDIKSQVVDIAVGKCHFLALTVEGDVYSFGGNSCGQLGLGSMQDTWRPTLVGRLRGRPIRQVACGDFHSVALAENGDVYVWGKGTDGQTGLKNPSQTTPRYLSSLRVPCQSVCCGSFVTAAVTNDGKVLAWGAALTLGKRRQTPTEIGLPELVRAVSAGYGHLILLGQSGTAYALGFSTSGALGVEVDPDSGNSLAVKVTSATPIKIPAGAPVRSVCCAQSYSAFLLETGEVFVCGDGTGGKFETSRNHKFNTPMPHAELKRLKLPAEAVACANGELLAFIPTSVFEVAPSCILRTGGTKLAVNCAAVYATKQAYVRLANEEEQVILPATCDPDASTLSAAVPALVPQADMPAAAPSSVHLTATTPSPTMHRSALRSSSRAKNSSRATHHVGFSPDPVAVTDSGAMSGRRSNPSTAGDSPLRRKSSARKSVASLMSRRASSVARERALRCRVRVVTVVRPFNAKERRADRLGGKGAAQGVVLVEEDTTKLINPKTGHVDEFSFDLCADTRADKQARSTNEVVCRDVSPYVIGSLLADKPVALLTLGATGSGKSHSLFGTDKDHGIVSQTVAKLLATVAKRDMREPRISHQVDVALFYLAHGKVWDAQTESPTVRRVRVVYKSEEHHGHSAHAARVPSVEITNLTQTRIHTAKEFEAALDGALAKFAKHGIAGHFAVRVIVRRYAKKKVPPQAMAADAPDVNPLNKTFQFRPTDAAADQLTSRVTLESAVRADFFDVRGSYKLPKGGSPSKEKIREVSSINRDTAALRNTISTLHNAAVKAYRQPNRARNAVVSYRDSLVTLLSQDCLSGFGNVVLVGTVSPSRLAYEDTLMTMKYAQQMRLSEPENVRSSGLYPLPPSPPQSPKNTTTPAQVLPADSKATPPSSQTPPDSSAGLPPSRFVEHSRSAQDAKEDVKDDVSAGVREDAKANTTPSKQHDPNFTSTTVDVSASLDGTHYSQPFPVPLYDHPDSTSVSFGPQVVPIQGGSDLWIKADFTPVQYRDVAVRFYHGLSADDSSHTSFTDAPASYDAKDNSITCSVPPFPRDDNNDDPMQWPSSKHSMAMSLNGQQWMPLGDSHLLTVFDLRCSAITPSSVPITSVCRRSPDAAPAIVQLACTGLHDSLVDLSFLRCRFTAVPDAKKPDDVARSVECEASYTSEATRRADLQRQRKQLLAALEEKRQREAAEVEAATEQEAQAAAEDDAVDADDKSAKKTKKKKPKKQSRAEKEEEERAEAQAQAAAEEKARVAAEEDEKISSLREALNVPISEWDAWRGVVTVPLPEFAQMEPCHLKIELCLNDADWVDVGHTLRVNGPSLSRLEPSCGPLTGGTAVKLVGGFFPADPIRVIVSSNTESWTSEQKNQEHRGAFGSVVAEDAGDAPAGQTQEEEDSKDAGTTAVEDDVGTDESGAGADTTDDDEPHVRWSTTEVSTRGRCDVRAEVGPAANSSYPLMATHARSFLFYEEPEVESITPDKGSATGGDEITVMGLRLIDTKQATVRLTCAEKAKAKGTAPRVVTRVVPATWVALSDEDIAKRDKKTKKAKGKGKGKGKTEEKDESPPQTDPQWTEGKLVFTTPTFEDVAATEATVEVALNGQQYVQAPKALKLQKAKKSKK